MRERLREWGTVGDVDMIRIGLCEDDGALLEKLKGFVESCFAEERIFAQVEAFGQGRDLLYEIEDGRRFDFLVLDIEMPQMDGMELAGRVRGLLPEALVIFLTSHMEYVLDAYELSIFRYVPKADSGERLRHALLDAAAMVQIQLGESYIIQNQNRLERIPLKRLLYITHEGKNAVLVTDCADGTGKAACHRVRKTLQQVYGELDEREFLFIDRGCIVNLSQVMSIGTDSCVLRDGTRLAVSRAKVQGLRERLMEFWKRHM